MTVRTLSLLICSLASERFSRSAAQRNLLRRFFTSFPTVSRHLFCASTDRPFCGKSNSGGMNLSITDPPPHTLCASAILRSQQIRGSPQGYMHSLYVYTHTIRSSGQRVNKRVSHLIEECTKFLYTDANRILNCLYALLFLVNCILLPWGLVIIIFLYFVKCNKVYI